MLQIAKEETKSIFNHIFNAGSFTSQPTATNVHKCAISLHGNGQHVYKHGNVHDHECRDIHDRQHYGSVDQRGGVGPYSEVRQVGQLGGAYGLRRCRTAALLRWTCVAAWHAGTTTSWVWRMTGHIEYHAVMNHECDTVKKL